MRSIKIKEGHLKAGVYDCWSEAKVGDETNILIPGSDGYQQRYKITKDKEDGVNIAVPIGLAFRQSRVIETPYTITKAWKLLKYKANT